jgi:hypothetical protein
LQRPLNRVLNLGSRRVRVIATLRFSSVKRQFLRYHLTSSTAGDKQGPVAWRDNALNYMTGRRKKPRRMIPLLSPVTTYTSRVPDAEQVIIYFQTGENFFFFKNKSSKVPVSSILLCLRSSVKRGAKYEYSNERET